MVGSWFRTNAMLQLGKQLGSSHGFVTVSRDFALYFAWRSLTSYVLFTFFFCPALAGQRRTLRRSFALACSGEQEIIPVVTNRDLEQARIAQENGMVGTAACATCARAHRSVHRYFHFSPVFRHWCTINGGTEWVRKKSSNGTGSATKTHVKGKVRITRSETDALASTRTLKYVGKRRGRIMTKQRQATVICFPWHSWAWQKLKPRNSLFIADEDLMRTVKLTAKKSTIIIN